MILFRWVRRLLAVAVLVGVAVVAVTAFRVWQVARTDGRPRSDVVVVLGASQFQGRPSEVFEARLRHAKALYDDGVAPRVLTLGGNQPGDRFTEGSAGAEYLRDHGVPPAGVVAVGEGTDTLRSLRAAKNVMADHRWRSAVVVTDPWHSLRARRMARDLGIKAETSPARSGPAVRSRSTEIRYVARETAAYLYYRAFHRSSDAGPRAV